ncbi:chitinase [Streptomyces sp. NBC_01187]|uniref:chitinase n=1 Tax=Streptomyces sp. NBC_01187 TaxID=2903766 RepID=UPI00386EE83A|nr:chitinase [Streptomyces sp. NBC_01187]
MARNRSLIPRRFRTRALVGLTASALAAAGLFAFGAAQANAGASASPEAGPRVGASKVPAHAVTGYWQNFNNGAKVQTLADVQKDYDIVSVAFADATTSPGQVDFKLDPALNYSEDQFKADIAAKHAEGKSVVISVGGEKGAVSVSDDASADAFAKSITGLMDKYGFDGVDIDLENGLNSTYMTKALESIHAAKSDVVVTMAPQTIDMQSPQNEYFKTALNIKSFLTVVNMQYYNSGSMNGCDGKTYSAGTVDFLTSLACVQIKGGLDPSQVGIGTPASSRAAGSGYVEPGVVNDALDCLAKGERCGSFTPDQKWPGIRGAMTWSTNWDATDSDKWSSTVGPHVHGL